MSKVLNVAVVGCGIGRTHAAAFGKLPDLYRVAVICDVNRERAAQVAALNGNPEVSTSFSEVCNRKDIDIVDICTPASFHRDQVLEALAARKHVICEKPLVGSLQELDVLEAAEKKSGKRLMPIFQYRFGRGAHKLKFLIERGLAGTPYLATVETHWRRGAAYFAGGRGKWSTDLGGCLTIHAIHAHDILSHLFGPVQSVFARTATRVNAVETEDCAAASLVFKNGALATLSATLGSCKEITRHRFCFSKVCAESNLRPYNNGEDPWEFTGDTPEEQAAIEQALRDFEPRRENFEGQFERYHQALLSDAPPPVTLGDARTSLELLTALYASSRTNQPVTLPITSSDPYYGGWQR